MEENSTFIFGNVGCLFSHFGKEHNSNTTIKDKLFH